MSAPSKVTFPDSYGAANLAAGKDAEFCRQGDRP